MTPRFASRLALVTVGAAGCSKTIPAGGLLLQMSDDGTLTPAPDKLHVEVGRLDGGAMYRDADYMLANADGALGATIALPASMVIESNGDPTASVAIHLSVWSGARPLDVRGYQAIDIPTDRFEESYIVFSSNCTRWAALDGGVAVSTCPQAGTTCDPTTGDCTSDVLGADAGPPSTDVDGSFAEGEAGVPEATLADGGDEGAGTSADAGDSACLTACVSLTCNPGSDTTRCNGDTPQRCAADGGWQDEKACSLQGPQYCANGRCVPTPPSCLDETNGGACTSYEVTGGMFFRSDDSLHMDMSAPATVSTFRLDEYEVVVSRFRKFVTAVEVPSGWLPQKGDGKHAHLNGGGLVTGGNGVSVQETGWDVSWNANLATTAAQWNANLQSCLGPTWYPQAGINPTEDYPINCVTWYEAYAFCIWDGGFLPTEAEWNYAAAGGDEQRLYPWGDMDPGTGSAYAVYGCVTPGSGGCGASTLVTEFGALPLAGQGRFGQLSLAGNVAEWTLDVYADYVAPCSDCAALAAGTQRVYRGGGYDQSQTYLYTSKRVPADPATRFSDVGLRCARVP